MGNINSNNGGGNVRRRSNSINQHHHHPRPPPVAQPSENRYVFPAASPYPPPQYPPAANLPPPQPQYYHYPGGGYYHPPPPHAMHVPLPAPFDHHHLAVGGPQGYPYGGHAVVPPPPPLQQHHQAQPLVDHQKATTIKNEVNIRKETLRVVPDEENPGCFLVAFTFDATTDGSITLLFFAKETNNCKLIPMKENLFKPVTISFKEGLCQNFRQPSGTGINFSMFGQAELAKGGELNVYPLVVKAEATPGNQRGTEKAEEASPVDKEGTENTEVSPVDKKEEPGDDDDEDDDDDDDDDSDFEDDSEKKKKKKRTPDCQITQAVFKKDDGEYEVQVVKQILRVNGVRYELREIFGIGNLAEGDSFDANDPGKECVICLSEPRDTAVIPCRHMCLCSGCAQVLSYQANRCPICRQPIVSLLKIDLNVDDNLQQQQQQEATPP